VPPYVTGFPLADCLDDCRLLQDCVKRGVKFRDIDGDGLPQEVGEPGLGGWRIRAYSFPGNVFQGEVTTSAVDGSYEFNTLTCNQTYTFCEVRQTGWTQTVPPPPPAGDVVSCAGIEPDPTIPLGPLGYREFLAEGAVLEDNDFGNFIDQQCPKFPTLNANVTIRSCRSTARRPRTSRSTGGSMSSAAASR
jgi:hypothetical protein